MVGIVSILGIVIVGIVIVGSQRAPEPNVHCQRGSCSLILSFMVMSVGHLQVCELLHERVHLAARLA